MTASALGTLTLYLSVFLLSIAFACLYQNTIDKGELRSSFAHTAMRCVVILPVAMLIGFRGFDVGWDTAPMLDSYFSDDKSLSELLARSRDPLSMVTFRFLFYACFGNATACLFVFSFATLYIMQAAILKWGDGVKLPFALFVYYLYFACIGMNQVRQMLAVSLVAYALVCLVKGEKRSFFIITIVAGLFHFTAFLGLAFYLFFVRDDRHPVLAASIVVACIAATAFSEVLFTQLGRFFAESSYAGYFVGESESQDVGLRFFLNVAPCLFPLFFLRRLPSETRALVVLSLIAVLPLRMLSYQSTFLGRLYYEPAVMLVFAYPLIRSTLSGRQRALFSFFSVAGLIVYYYLAFSTAHGVIPYSLSF